MATERVLHMKGGEGETSYTNNSLVQKKVILKVKTILEEIIKRMLSYTTIESVFNVADLGCCSGPNVFLVVYNIMNIINNTYNSLTREVPVAQFYLNDLCGNDFNTIFKSLPDFYQTVQKEKGNKVCFINATPGNFYGRLFPNNYIHFFHSSYGLHWLSQAPKDLTNKGSICLTNTSPSKVYQAYFEQFQKDFKLFLKSRMEELTPGGCMVLTFIGREKAHDFGHPPWVVIDMVLKDMVLEGLVDEAKLDSFDMPIYGPTLEEVREVIKEEGSFTLQTLNSFKISWDAKLQEDVDNCVLDSNNMRAEIINTSAKAVFEPLLEAEFGKDMMDEFFSRYKKKVTQLMELETLDLTNLVVSMRKDP